MGRTLSLILAGALACQEPTIKKSPELNLDICPPPKTGLAELRDGISAFQVHALEILNAQGSCVYEEMKIERSNYQGGFGSQDTLSWERVIDCGEQRYLYYGHMQRHFSSADWSIQPKPVISIRSAFRVIEPFTDFDQADGSFEFDAMNFGDGPDLGAFNFGNGVHCGKDFCLSTNEDGSLYTFDLSRDMETILRPALETLAEIDVNLLGASPFDPDLDKDDWLKNNKLKKGRSPL